MLCYPTMAEDHSRATTALGVRSEPGVVGAHLAHWCHTWPPVVATVRAR